MTLPVKIQSLLNQLRATRSVNVWKDVVTETTNLRDMELWKTLCRSPFQLLVIEHGEAYWFCLDLSITDVWEVEPLGPPVLQFGSNMLESQFDAHKFQEALQSELPGVEVICDPTPDHHRDRRFEHFFRHEIEECWEAALEAALKR